MIAATLIGALAKVVGPAIADELASKVPKPEANRLATRVVEDLIRTVEADPVIRNELNAESPLASRVLWGLGIAGSGAVGLASIPLAQLMTAIATVLIAFGIDFPAEEQALWVAAGDSAVTIAGLVYAAYGRLRSGLAPMWPRLGRLWQRLTA